MRILFITPLFPYPLESGGQIRFFNLIKRLSANHQITLFSFVREEEEKDFIPKILPYCQKVKIFKRRKAWSIFNILLCGFSRLPFLCATYWSPSFKKALRKELSSEKYDLIHLESFYTGTSLPETKIPLLLIDHNIEYQVYKQFASRLKLIPLRPFLYFDVWKMKKMETSFWKTADEVAVVSHDDQKQMEKILSKKCKLVLNGVDFSHFSQVKRKVCKEPRVLFVGNTKWFPNRDAVLFLVTQIWDKVKQQAPDAKLWVVGRNFSKEFLRFARKDIVFDDRVGDIREAYSSADVLIVPLRVGGGIKFKVLEAMASSLPVVSTKIGVEGIEAGDEKEYLLGETPNELSRATVKLLGDKALRERIGKAAQKFVGQSYDWDKIVKNLNKIYEEILRY